MAKYDEYPILIAPLSSEDGGGFIAIVPDLQGCMSDGETQEEALKNAQQAVLEWIDAASQTGKKVPAPHSAAERGMKQKRDLEKKVMEQAKKIAALTEELGALRIDVEAFGATWPIVALTKNHKELVDDIVQH